MVCLGNMCVDTLHKGDNDDDDYDNNDNNNNTSICVKYTFLEMSSFWENEVWLKADVKCASYITDTIYSKGFFRNQLVIS